MNHERDAGTCPRCTSAEVTRLVSEYPASGLSRERFCRIHNRAGSVLTRRLKKMREGGTASTPAGNGVRVEVPSSSSPHSPAVPSDLVLALTGGRRIEPARGFDAATLRQLRGLPESL